MEIPKFVEENICFELLAVIWILYLWELYLSMRQRKLMTSLELPPKSLDGIIPQDVYQKARSYSLDKNTFSNYSSFYATVINTLFVLTFAYRHFWQWGSDLIAFFGLNSNSEIFISGACMFIMDSITLVKDLPFTVYNIFVLEEKHGFNKQTPAFFIKDQLKKFLVIEAIGIPFVSTIIWIVRNSGSTFYIYVGGFTIVITLCMSVIYPEVIAPLFDKYSPLPEGELKQKIESLAASVDYPLYKLYIVEGSKRSSHSNAYLYGFHKNKRIVLFDTLVKGYCSSDEKDKNEDKKKEDEDRGCETDEILGVLAHELGHWKYNHPIKGLILAYAIFCVDLLGFVKLLGYRPMYRAFGFTRVQPILIGLIIVNLYILHPVNTLLHFLLTVISRRFEFQADKFSDKLGHGEPLKRALVKLHKDNLSYPVFDSLYSGWHHNHPPLLERLSALDKTD